MQVALFKGARCAHVLPAAAISGGQPGISNREHLRVLIRMLAVASTAAALQTSMEPNMHALHLGAIPLLRPVFEFVFEGRDAA